jgi:hypothetical protein
MLKGMFRRILLRILWFCYFVDLVMVIFMSKQNHLKFCLKLGAKAFIL